MDETQEEKKVTMIEGDITPDAHVMIGAILSVLRMKEASVGTSAMLAVLSAHFANIGCSKEEFSDICGDSFSFYKTHIDEENAKRKENG